LVMYLPRIQKNLNKTQKTSLKVLLTRQI